MPKSQVRPPRRLMDIGLYPASDSAMRLPPTRQNRWGVRRSSLLVRRFSGSFRSQPIMLRVLLVKVQPRELTVYPRSHTRRFRWRQRE